MTFIIDTGAAEPHGPYISAPYDHVIDMLPPGATEADINRAMAHAIMGEMRKPKKTDTVRKTIMRHWGRIAELAATDPDLFDAVLLEYAERVTATS